MKLVKGVRALSDDALRSKLAELRKELMKYNAQIAIGTVPKSPGAVRSIKRSIARILTIMNERERGREREREGKRRTKAKV